MWTTNTQSASVIQLRAEGNQTQKEAVILKQLFCDWSTLLPSPRLSNKAWSLFPHILQNVLMRPNPFNSCPNCQSYGYNCVWLCARVCVCAFVYESSEHFLLLLEWKGKSSSFLWRGNHIKDIKRSKKVIQRSNFRPNEHYLARPTVRDHRLA